LQNMQTTAFAAIGRDTIKGKLRVAAVIAERVLRCNCASNASVVLIDGHRHLRRSGKIFSNADAEVALILHRTAHYRHLVKAPRCPSGLWLYRNDGAVDERSGDVRSVGVRRSLQLQNALS